MDERIFGMTWGEIRARQQGASVSRRVDTAHPGDYGADPIGDDRFRMVPSGEIVDGAERDRRLAGRAP